MKTLSASIDNLCRPIYHEEACFLTVLTVFIGVANWEKAVERRASRASNEFDFKWGGCFDLSFKGIKFYTRQAVAGYKLSSCLQAETDQIHWVSKFKPAWCIIWNLNAQIKLFIDVLRILLTRCLWIAKVQPQIIATTRYSKSVNPWRDIAEEMNRLFSLLY